MDAQRQNDPPRGRPRRQGFACPLLFVSESPAVISLLAETEAVPTIFRRKLRDFGETFTSFEERRRERESRGEGPARSDCQLLGMLDRHVFDLRVLADQLADDGHPLSTLIVQTAQTAERAADGAAMELLAAHRGNTRLLS